MNVDDRPRLTFNSYRHDQLGQHSKLFCAVGAHQRVRFRVCYRQRMVVVAIRSHTLQERSRETGSYSRFHASLSIFLTNRFSVTLLIKLDYDYARCAERMTQNLD